MNTKPTLTRPGLAAITLAATLSAFIAIGLFAAVTGLFQREGAPFELMVAAERACAEHGFVSERENCVRVYLESSHARRLASR